MPKSMAEMTPWPSDCAAHSTTATRLYFNSPPEAPKNWGQVNTNLNDYHSEPKEIICSFLLPEIINWWHQYAETQPKYADLSKTAHSIISIIPHGVRFEAGFDLPRDVLSWRQSKTSGKTLEEKVFIRQFAQVNNKIFRGRLRSISYHADAEWIGIEERCGGKKIEQNGQGPWLFGDVAGQPKPMCHTKGISRPKQANDSHKYISDTEQIIKASRSNFLHEGAAAFQLSAKSPLPPALSATDLPEGWTEAFNVHRHKRIECHPAKSNDDSASESICDTPKLAWLEWLLW